MHFGEILEPVTRALIDDEVDSYPEYIPPQLQWSQTSATPPEHINKLFLIETIKIINLFDKLFLENQQPIATLINGGIEIYRLPSDTYIVMFKGQKDLTLGQIVEASAPWLAVSKNTIAITSASISLYLNETLITKPVSLIKCLTTNVANSLGCEKLESPNLVTGLGASVLSYSIHMGMECSLFVLYLDSTPLDSVNSSPLLQLLNLLKMPVKTLDIKLSLPSNNLYM